MDNIQIFFSQLLKWVSVSFTYFIFQVVVTVTQKIFSGLALPQVIFFPAPFIQIALMKSEQWPVHINAWHSFLFSYLLLFGKSVMNSLGSWMVDILHNM